MRWYDVRFHLAPLLSGEVLEPAPRSAKPISDGDVGIFVLVRVVRFVAHDELASWNREIDAQMKQAPVMAMLVMSFEHDAAADDARIIAAKLVDPRADLPFSRRRVGHVTEGDLKGKEHGPPPILDLSMGDARHDATSSSWAGAMAPLVQSLSRMNTHAGLWLLALALGPAETVSLETSISELGSPHYLPQAARGLLAERMHRHGDDLMGLTKQVVLLAYEDAAATADRIGDEPGLTRPRPDELDTLNARLPSAFFDLQDLLRRRARDLAGAARRHDDRAMASAYAELAQSCVTCHSIYLRGPQKPKERP